jgi:hypothetical protein
LNKTKKIKNEWIVNSKNPNLEKQNIVLYKDGNVYSFDCVKSAAAHIGCVIYAVYDLLKGRTNSVYGYKTK